MKVFYLQISTTWGTVLIRARKILDPNIFLFKNPLPIDQ